MKLDNFWKHFPPYPGDLTTLLGNREIWSISGRVGSWRFCLQSIICHLLNILDPPSRQEDLTVTAYYYKIFWEGCSLVLRLKLSYNALFQKISIPLPCKVFLVWTPHPSGKFQFSFTLSFKNFGYWDPPPPRNFQWRSLGWVWIFFGTAQWPFSKYKIMALKCQNHCRNLVFLPLMVSEVFLNPGWGGGWVGGGGIRLCFERVCGVGSEESNCVRGAKDFFVFKIVNFSNFFGGRGWPILLFWIRCFLER